MKQPPLIGPKPLPRPERPKCICCGRPLIPDIYAIWRALSMPHGTYTSRVARYWRGTYGYLNSFCGINCAATWALRQPRALERQRDIVRFTEPKDIPQDVTDRMKMAYVAEYNEKA